MTDKDIAETEEGAARPTNFIRQIIENDLQQGNNLPRYWCGHPAPYAEQLDKGQPDWARIRTRFPPEPNGYLHIGHAKSICLNFGLAADYKGVCHMRFDDTNPVKEDQEYVDAIKESVRWMGFDWKSHGEDNLYHASDYFDWMYQFAEHLIKTGYAYVDEQSADEMRANRGTLREPGKNSPFRDRTPEENLRIFRAMREGKHPEGSMVLRAKIDMASPNINLRDPAIYRIPLPNTRARARSGASTRCTRSRTRSKTRSKTSLTRSARSNSTISAPSTTGPWSASCRCCARRSTKRPSD